MLRATIKTSSAPLVAIVLAVGVATPAYASPITANPSFEDVDRSSSTVSVGEDVVEADNSGIVFDVVDLPDGQPAVLQSVTTESSGDIPVVSSLATEDAVQLSWDAISEATTFTVFRDGQAIASLTGDEFVDNAPNAGGAYSYMIEARTPAEYAPADFQAGGYSAPLAQPETPAQGPSIYDPNLVESPPSDEPAPDRVILMGTNVALPTDETAASAEQVVQAQVAAAAAATTSAIRHTTFIPTPTAPGFPCSLPGRYFGGDNRGFSTSSSAFRTRLQADINWTNGGTVSQTKTTSSTHLYNSNGTLNETRNAGTSGMTVTVTARSSTQVRLSATHSIGNPFCVAGAIDYKWSALIYRTGSYTVNGDYRPAPNHEIYLRTGNNWSTVFQRSNQGFSCLTGICGRDNIQVSR